MKSRDVMPVVGIRLSGVCAFGGRRSDTSRFLSRPPSTNQRRLVDALKCHNIAEVH